MHVVFLDMEYTTLNNFFVMLLLKALHVTRKQWAKEVKSLAPTPIFF